MKEIIIKEQEQNQRLDKFLLKYMNEASKSFIYKMLRKKRIKYNGKRAEGSELIQAGDCLTLYLSDETLDGFMGEKTVKKTMIRFDVIYEDEKILLVNKPAGVIVHPDKDNKDNTLTDMLLYYLYTKGEYATDKTSTFTPSICNRLDRNTSGLVVCAKDLRTAQEVNEALREHQVEKHYKTIVKGRLTAPGVLTAYHVKHDDNTVQIFSHAVPNSKKIITAYTPVQYSDAFTLLDITLITGKSHQIRASLQDIRHPIVGDPKYGDKQTNDWFAKKFNVHAQLLHAEQIMFTTDTFYLNGKFFCAQLPNVFSNIVHYLF